MSAALISHAGSVLTAEESIAGAGFSGPSTPHPLSAIVGRLLEQAVTAMEIEPETARDFLSRASALLRADSKPQAVATAHSGGAVLAPWQIRRAIAYIDDHIETNIRLDDVAEVSRLSTSYFSRAFKGSLGQSPHNFIVGRRIARAQVLMLTEDEPLCHVALRCGFADQAHFSRVFRRVVGCAPNEWRRGNRCEPSQAGRKVATVN